MTTQDEKHLKSTQWLARNHASGKLMQVPGAWHPALSMSGKWEIDRAPEGTPPVCKPTEVPPDLGGGDSGDDEGAGGPDVSSGASEEDGSESSAPESEPDVDPGFPGGAPDLQGLEDAGEGDEPHAGGDGLTETGRLQKEAMEEEGDRVNPPPTPVKPPDFRVTRDTKAVLCAKDGCAERFVPNPTGRKAKYCTEHRSRGSR